MPLTQRQQVVLRGLAASQRPAMKAKFERDNAQPPKKQPPAKKNVDVPPRKGKKPGPKPSRKMKTRSILDPRVSGIPPSMFNVGRGIGVDDCVRFQVSTDATYKKIILVLSRGSFSSVAMDFSDSATGGAPTIRDLPRLAAETVSGGPAAAQASKIGVAVSNITKSDSLQGQVYFHRTQDKVSNPAALSAMTTTQIRALYDSLISHPLTKWRTAEQLVNPHFMYAGVRNEVDYQTFNQWQGPSGTDTFMLTAAVVSEATNYCPMDIMWILIPECSTTQTYFISVHAQFVCRYPHTAVMSSQESWLPTAESSVVNAQRRAAAVLGEVNEVAKASILAAGTAILPEVGLPIDAYEAMRQLG